MSLIDLQIMISESMEAKKGKYGSLKNNCIHFKNHVLDNVKKNFETKKVMGIPVFPSMKKSPEIIVDLKNAAKDAQGFRKGIYFLGPNTVNGKHYWIQKGGSNALWYISLGSWLIGPKDSLGKDMAGILSYDGSAGPLEAKTWNYTSGGKWIDGSDMITLSSNTGLNHFNYKNLIMISFSCRYVLRPTSSQILTFDF